MKISEKYINGLKEAYLKTGRDEEWTHFEKNIHGASEEDILKLKELYPNIPDSLVDLLKYVDGTYWRAYGSETVGVLVIGSDIEEYGYYLLSSKEIIENQNIVRKYAHYSAYINREYCEVKVDEKIIDKSASVKWLHFSDCMNNGGTSQLFIDFTPSPNGKIGQIVRFVHDPDNFKVIADSFDDYLKMLMDSGYDFINEDDFF
ncbi:MAG: SMI1/KNR4 family protein [Defluviitaleaceae bacterium]|nr:SMI1/KNR4 family protein [Defluviitaleaceae bacterium]MCL2263653.1 SMI1/KNR4 family protein [Defluviitaleaceae bacterium]MCL2263886.1 SMI1/KNR4 family protein [Defluviitaleaceae bacterium]